jgi:CheY-like chemotaxis protein
MEIKSGTPNPPALAGIARERFTRPLDCLMHKLFINRFVFNKVLALVLQKIMSGNFRPYFGEVEANKLLSEKLASTFPYFKPEEMDSAGKWEHIISNIAASMCSDIEFVRSAGPRDSKEDITEAKQNMVISIKSLKVIEDWFYYHPEALKKIFSPGLLPKIHAPNRPFIVHKVLVVDDNKEFLSLCKDYLEESLGLALTIADPANPKVSIQELIRNGEIHSHDLVIMDGNLPQTSGTELVKLLRAAGFSGFIIANSNMLSCQEEMLAAGADLKTPYPKNVVALSHFFFEI